MAVLPSRSWHLSALGLSTHVVLWGGDDRSRPLIIALHGWNGSAESWAVLAPLLVERGYRVLAVDVPGFGQSDTPAEPWDSHHYARWVADLLQGLLTQGMTPQVLLGHSNGGRIWVRYLQAHPECQLPTVLLGIPGMQLPPTLRVRLVRWVTPRLRWLHTLLPHRVYDWLRRKVLRAHDWVSTPAVLRQTMQRLLAEPDIREELPGITAPVLLLWGRKDSYTPVAGGHLYHQYLPRSALIIYPEARHGTLYTHAEPIADALDRFVQAPTAVLEYTDASLQL